MPLEVSGGLKYAVFMKFSKKNGLGPVCFLFMALNGLIFGCASVPAGPGAEERLLSGEDPSGKAWELWGRPGPGAQAVSQLSLGQAGAERTALPNSAGLRPRLDYPDMDGNGHADPMVSVDRLEGVGSDTWIVNGRTGQLLWGPETNALLRVEDLGPEVPRTQLVVEGWMSLFDLRRALPQGVSAGAPSRLQRLAHPSGRDQVRWTQPLLSPAGAVLGTFTAVASMNPGGDWQLEDLSFSEAR